MIKHTFVIALYIKKTKFVFPYLYFIPKYILCSKNDCNTRQTKITIVFNGQLFKKCV